MDHRIKRDELLKILEENKEKHRTVYEEAKQAYLDTAKEKLEEKLSRVSRGLVTDLFIELPVPEDHTRDYERVIRMLGLEVRDEIELSDAEAQRYVMDDWPWRRAWVQNTASYTGYAAEYA